MNRARFIIFFSVLLVVPTTTYLVIQLARGFRPDFANRTIKPTGILVAESSPTGAKLWISGKLTSATNNTINLDPDTYAVEINKPGFHPWTKTLRIEKELVTQVDAWLLPQTPESIPVVASAVSAVFASPDRGKISFIIPRPSPSPRPPTTRLPIVSPTPTPATLPHPPGIYVLDLTDFPFNLNREPRPIAQVSDLKATPDWSKAILVWSPDSRSILARIPRDPNCTDFENTTKPCSVLSAYVLDTSRENTTLTNILATHKQLLTDWQSQARLELEAKIAKLPKVLIPTFTDLAASISFSPDNTKILYVATGSATIPEQVIPPIPAANSQPQERLLKPGKIYVYDLHEDRNFAVGEIVKPQVTTAKTQKTKPASIGIWDLGFAASKLRLVWLPSSRHLLEFDSGRVYIKEYDNANKVEVVSNGLVGENAYPSSAGNRLFVLLNVPESTTSPGLFSLALKP